MEDDEEMNFWANKAYCAALRATSKNERHENNPGTIFYRLGCVMKKTMFVVGIIVAMISLGIPMAHARPDQRYDAGSQTTRDLLLSNRRAGYTIFRNFCKSCHSRENEKAPFLHTESQTMNGWNTVFYNKHPQCAK